MGKKERLPEKREVWLASVIGRFIVGALLGVVLWLTGCSLAVELLLRTGLPEPEWPYDPVRFLFFTLGCGFVAVILPDEFFRRLSGEPQWRGTSRSSPPSNGIDWLR